MCPHQKKKEYFQSTRTIMIWTKIHFIKIYPKQISNLFSSSSLKLVQYSVARIVYLFIGFEAIIEPYLPFFQPFTLQPFFPVFISFNLVLARARDVSCKKVHLALCKNAIINTTALQLYLSEALVLFQLGIHGLTDRFGLINSSLTISVAYPTWK